MSICPFVWPHILFKKLVDGFRLVLVVGWEELYLKLSGLVYLLQCVRERLCYVVFYTLIPVCGPSNET